MGVVIPKAFLKWLFKATLILGLTTFSVNITGYESCQRESPKTELRETSKSNQTKTAYFKKFYCGLSYSFSESAVSQAAGFTSYLVQYENSVRLRLKCNRIKITTIQNPVKHFLKYLPSDITDGSDTDSAKG
jgi:hypothetical protein